MTDLELERMMADGPGVENLGLADRAAAARLRADHDAFLAGADVELRVAHIASALRWRRRAPRIGALGVAAAAAATIAWWVSRPSPEPTAVAVTPALAIAVDTRGGAFPLSAAAVVEAGDTLRFTVDAPAGFVAIVAPPAVLVSPRPFGPSTRLTAQVEWTGERDVYAVYASTWFDAAAVPSWVSTSAPVHLRAIPQPPVMEAPANAD